MDQNLKTILDFIQHNENLSAEEKALLVGLVSNVDKELSITTFKLDRTEKVKRTTAILLEETIEELEQKRKAVEMQNRELEIESSLERVRTVAMGMRKKDDMLEVCSIISQQSEILGIKEIRNVQTAIIYEEKGTYLNYEYYAKHDKHLVTEVEYKNHKLQSMFANRMLQGAEELFYESMNGKEVQEWYEYQKTTNQFADSFLENAQSLNYYFYSLGPVALGISSYKPLSDEEINLFKRFRNVFDMAYRRFLDIEKAEFQARESQIELALERVRARTMAMLHSNELAETVAVMFEQFKALGEEPERMAIEIVNEKKHVFDIWATQHGGSQLSESVQISLDEPHVMKKMYKAWKEKTKSITIDLQGNELEEYFQFLKKMGLPVQRKIFGKRRVQNVATFSKGILTIITPEPRPQETIQLLERFAAVFDGTYTRFFDLQKAEAQAREAKIEAAMEKIRSCSMAMQKPEELIEVAEILRREMGQLGVEELETSSIYLVSEDNQTAKCWYAIKDVREGNSKLVSDEITIVFRETWVASMMWDFYNSAEEQGSIVMTGNNRKEWINYCADRSQILQGYYGSEIPARSYHLVKFNGGYLGAAAPGEISAESWKLIKRATKVFSLAYTRFSDLKQAKVQAREAQIEAALERVRSRTMGMQKSVELKEVIKIVQQQLTHLKIKLDHAGFVVDYKPKGDWHFWIADERDIPSQITHPWFESVWANQFNEAKEKGGELFATLLNFEEKNKFYNKLLSYVPGLPEASRDFYLSCPGLAATTVLSDNVSLYIENFSGTPYTAEENNILIRFARVFEQTYTRFLDLQKAEDQAREALIELSLERIRAQVTAMRESSELLDIVVTMRSEFVALGHEAHYFWHMRWLPEKYEKAMTSGDGTRIGMVMTLPRHLHGDIKLVADWEKSDEPAVVLAMDVETAVAYVEKMITLGDFEVVDHNAPTLDDIRHIGGLTFVMARTTHGEIGFSLPGTVHHPPAESIATLTRFASVFDLAFKRFEDLKSTERQHREAQIELALERTRNQSMRMQHSGELNDISKTFHEQLLSLGIDSEFSFVWLPDEVKQEHMFWATWVSGINDVAQYESKSVKYPLDKTEPGTAKCYMDWESGQPIHETYIPPDQIDSFFATWEALLEGAEQFKPELFPEGIYYTEAYMKYGCFGIDIRRQLTSEEKEIIRRFSVEFERTYTRFLDLQKAEAQAREAQIEAALEKVRSRSLAMHKSDELNEVVKVLFEKMIELQVPSTAVGIQTFTEGTKDVQVFVCGDVGTGLVVNQYLLPYFDHPIIRDYLNAHKEKRDYFVGNYPKKEKDSFYDVVLKLPELKDLPIEVKTMIRQSDFYEVTMVPAEKSLLAVNDFKGNPLSESHINILKRFTKVFDQTYTRFLDLQKAEAQAREAQIQLALERVRARTMAMQSSEELAEVSYLLNKQVVDLGIPTRGCAFNIYGENESTEWFSNLDGTLPTYKTPRDNIFLKYYQAGQRGETLLIKEFDGERIRLHYKYLMSLQLLGNAEKEEEEILKIMPERQIDHVAYFKFGYLLFITLVPAPGAHDVFKRFAKEFEQTYTRFLDLQKAEAQAREAQIEAALERVRSRTMAMRKSEELLEVASTVFQQVKALGVPQWDCGVNIWNDGDAEFTYYPGTRDGEILPSPCKIPLLEHPVFRKFHESRKRGDDLFIYEKQSKEQEDHYQYMLSVPVLGDLLRSLKDAGFQFPKYQIDHLANFAYGNLIFITYEHFPEMHDVFKRFAKVFEQTYTRFLDLQKAEAQAIEATKRASVDRVRAEIASMRTTKDLERITPLIWNELTTLGVPFIRSGVFIMDEAHQQVQVHLSSPDGKAIAAFQLNYEASVQSRQIVSHWREMKVFKDHMDEAAFAEYTKNLVRQGALTGDEKYVTENHPTDLYLHFLPFAQGMLYVGNDAPLKEEELLLVQNLADAFSTAYARYEDFNKLEAAKLQVDKALVNLKQAQQQLVQSEKMASLGELTAGIAHEIQNPLNFVNNFSEVSSELVDEMNEELSKGNLEDAIEIATDLKQNLEKITHHGKRAGEIVKGMLQHSRTSSGQKELTDLNVLADEYLRLAYHGLRAKDKTFNLKMETDFDPSLPKIEVVPQDIGRVILNLITNAFYVVNEKSKQGIAGYEPTVSVSTKKKEKAIEISVKDNGNGIPQKVIDKIFQPFFTTKPTGQGTGLGLSLSYDIVKAHGGEIKINTKVNEGLPAGESGSTFIVQLPI